MFGTFPPRADLRTSNSIVFGVILGPVLQSPEHHMILCRREKPQINMFDVMLFLSKMLNNVCETTTELSLYLKKQLFLTKVYCLFGKVVH